MRIVDAKLTRCNRVCEEMIEATELLKLKLGEFREPRIPKPVAVQRGESVEAAAYLKLVQRAIEMMQLGS